MADDPNVYAAPITDDLGAVPAGNPDYLLFNPNLVAGATFLGSPLAGGICMSLNAQRAGLPVAPVALKSAGILVLVLVLGMLPLPGVIASLVGLFGMRAFAQVEQGALLEQHLQRGGTMAPWWHAVLVGLIGMVVFVGVIIVSVLCLGLEGL